MQGQISRIFPVTFRQITLVDRRWRDFVPLYHRNTPVLNIAVINVEKVVKMFKERMMVKLSNISSASSSSTVAASTMDKEEEDYDNVEEGFKCEYDMLASLLMQSSEYYNNNVKLDIMELMELAKEFGVKIIGRTTDEGADVAGLKEIYCFLILCKKLFVDLVHDHGIYNDDFSIEFMIRNYGLTKNGPTRTISAISRVLEKNKMIKTDMKTMKSKVIDINKEENVQSLLINMKVLMKLFGRSNLINKEFLVKVKDLLQPYSKFGGKNYIKLSRNLENLTKIMEKNDWIELLTDFVTNKLIEGIGETYHDETAYGIVTKFHRDFPYISTARQVCDNENGRVQCNNCTRTFAKSETLNSHNLKCEEERHELEMLLEPLTKDEIDECVKRYLFYRKDTTYKILKEFQVAKSMGWQRLRVSGFY